MQYIETKIVVATDKNDVIGIGDKIPWYSQEDFKYFKKQTEGCVCIMGRKTYDTLPSNMKVLDREFVVITRDTNKQSRNEIPVTFISDPETAFAFNTNFKNIVVIGGAEIYKHFIGKVDRIIRTLVHVETLKSNDIVQMPKFYDKYELISSEDSISKDPYLTFETWARK